MLRGRALARASVFLAAGLLWASPAAADVTIGGACSGTLGYGPQSNGNNAACVSSLWQYPAYQLGGTAAACNSTNAGMMQYTGGVFEGCNGSTWGSLASSGSVAFSSLLAATTTNSINNANYAQTWNWNTLAGISALTLSTTSAAAASNAQTLLNISLSGLNSTTTQTTYGVQISNAHTGTSSTNVGLYATATGGTNNYAAIFNQGYVGIGTTSPGYAVDVAGSINASTFVLAQNKVGVGLTNPLAYIHTLSSNNATYPDIMFSLYTDGTYRSGIANTFSNSSAAGNSMNFLVSNGTNTTMVTPMVLNGAGNVAIGTTSPGANLDLVSTSTGAAYALRSTISGNANTGYAAYFSNTATTANYGVYSTTASTGTGYGLYASITGASNTGYAGYFSNTTTTGIALWCSSSNPSGCGGNEAWYNSSDLRLKDAVTNLPPARGLASVLKLRPVTYHWKDKKRGESEHIGLIAQEVEPLYPEVIGSGPDGMKSMSYSDLVVPLIKAVQELKADNDNLRSEVEKQDAELAKLRKEVAAVKVHSGKN